MLVWMGEQIDRGGHIFHISEFIFPTTILLQVERSGSGKLSGTLVKFGILE